MSLAGLLSPTSSAEAHRSTVVVIVCLLMYEPETEMTVMVASLPYKAWMCGEVVVEGQVERRATSISNSQKLRAAVVG
jgi:hypothetical protein